MAYFEVGIIVQFLYVWVASKNDITVDDLFGHTVMRNRALSVDLLAWLFPVSVVKACHLLFVNLFLNCFKIEVIKLLFLEFLFAIAVHILIRQTKRPLVKRLSSCSLDWSFGEQ